MSTVLFFVMVGVLAVYGLCEGIVRLFAWLWIPRRMTAVTLVRCEETEMLTPLVRQLWEEKERHSVGFWTSETTMPSDERFSLSKPEEILHFLSE